MSALWIVVIVGMMLMPATALAAFGWACRSGQFRHVDRAALLIFDEEEPVGELSDYFPGHRPNLVTARAPLGGRAVAEKTMGLSNLMENGKEKAEGL